MSELIDTVRQEVILDGNSPHRFAGVGAPNQRRIITSITDEELKFTNPPTPAGVTLELVFKRAK